jgi:hypothetical protein
MRRIAISAMAVTLAGSAALLVQAAHGLGQSRRPRWRRPDLSERRPGFRRAPFNHTWRAYLSQEQKGAMLRINARDRIGTGHNEIPVAAPGPQNHSGRSAPPRPSTAKYGKLNLGRLTSA